jgi:predicted dehydrogenase
MSLGPEIWHPSPEFLYKKGAGPLFDMGPYYITALVHLLGGVKRVSGVARASFPERVIGRGPSQGRKFAVEVPTHIAAHLEFNSGPIATLITSFDIKAHNLPSIVVYGSERTLSIPDPIFGGVLRIGKPGPAGKPGTEEWEEVPFDREHLNNARGIGVVDMIRAIHAGVDHRCNERVGYHVLDVMHSIIDSAKRGRHLEISSAVVRPDAMPF